MKFSLSIILFCLFGLWLPGQETVLDYRLNQDSSYSLFEQTIVPNLSQNGFQNTLYNSIQKDYDQVASLMTQLMLTQSRITNKRQLLTKAGLDNYNFTIDTLYQKVMTGTWSYTGPGKTPIDITIDEGELSVNGNMLGTVSFLSRMNITVDFALGETVTLYSTDARSYIGLDRVGGMHRLVLKPG